MLRLDKVIKPWKESAALNDHINLYGFWNETAFLTKSGDLGMVLSISGVDYESLDHSEQEYAVKRLEAALKAFGPGFHVYQYLFKANRPDIPFAKHDEPIVEAAIDQRRKFFEAKRDNLYQVEIFYCVLLEGARSKTGVATALGRLLRDPRGTAGEINGRSTGGQQIPGENGRSRWRCDRSDLGYLQVVIRRSWRLVRKLIASASCAKIPTEDSGTLVSPAALILAVAVRACFRIASRTSGVAVRRRVTFPSGRHGE